ncbi:MAG: MFS transporter [Acidobacteria bacterium]|nr:MFS transporter [Acidobacteriota bacterium]MBI3280055.1 MFS transporter [Acidobacteriota bacterium]
MQPISRLRWWIGGLLFLSTVINYLDRQTLSVLAPYLKIEFSWTNSDFALIVIAFRIAYAIMQTLGGRVLDSLGTRLGLTLSVLWYSTAAMLTSIASGLHSFAAFRFLLGTGEAANWPGAAKTVSEWFPRSERGWAVALYDSGSAIGGAAAPLLVIWLYNAFGTWRPAFLIIGLLGFAWVIAWRALYHPPATHPRVSKEERAFIARDKQEEQAQETRALGEQQRPASWMSLLRLRQTWGIILGKSLTDPIWFFITDWFAIYLVAKGFNLQGALVGFWIPFLAADFGNFFGGGLSSWLIGRGWSVLAARKFVVLICGVGMAGLIPAAFTSNFALIVTLFAVSTFCYAAWSTMALALPADLYPSGSVATVSGMSGTGAGLGTILSTFLIGRVSDRYSFEPVLIAASLVPLVATALVFLLVRERRR